MTPSVSVGVAAPAKVNLFLHVLRRREDGFHELDTLFQAVDLCDDVVVTARPGTGVTLRVEGADVGPEKENLAYRAAAGFLDVAVGGRAAAPGFDLRSSAVAITLTKRIPAGAGLGGGPSDAAAVIRCMDALWPGALLPEELQKLAAGLGSDVPFFLGPSALSRGRGRGEVLTPLPGLPTRWLVLVLPPVHVATGPAYGALARIRAEGGTVVGAGPGVGAGGEAGDGSPGAGVLPTTWSGEVSWDAVAAAATNDFEAVVPEAYPEVARALGALRGAGAGTVLLSGSGGACFGVFPDSTAAGDAAVRIGGALGWPTHAVPTLRALPPLQSR